jgi:hypothetical protein
MISAPSFAKAMKILTVVCFLTLAVFVAMSVEAAAGRNNRVTLFPKLRTSQIISYEISYHSDKQVRSQSSLIVANPSGNARTDVHGLLRLEILSVESQGERAIVHARTRFEALNAGLRFKLPQTEVMPSQQQREDPESKAVEFTILPDGRLDQVRGLDELIPEQQQAWQEWASRFALAAGMPSSGIRISQKWKSEESEKSPSPIAKLVWVRESNYVRDEPCRPVQITVDGELADSDAEHEICAVILTTAALKQQSSTSNATPEDFQLHELRTSGIARGTNHIVTYISLKTGLMVRSTEDANQQMDVTVAKRDGTNRVRYGVRAKSQSEVLLVSDTARAHPASDVH